jgi:hypothetical protein
MGAAHFDTHSVGGAEGRAAGRCGGEGTRANITISHFTKIQQPLTQLVTTLGAAHFDTHSVGVWKGELPGVVGGRAPAPTQPQQPLAMVPLLHFSLPFP